MRYFNKYKLCVKKASRHLKKCNVRGKNGARMSMSGQLTSAQRKKNKNP